MRRYLMVLVCAGVLSDAHLIQAQNLLVNGDLEASPAFSYFDGVGSADPNLVPGWTMFGDTPPDASSWVQVAYDFGADTIDLDLSGSETSGADPDFIGLSGAATAVESRPAIVPGNLYVASVTYDNYFANAGVSYFIDWFDGGGSLVGSDGGLLGDVNGPLGYAPYTTQYEVSGIAPALATSAGVRFQSSNGGFAGAVADNFGLRQVPEPATWGLLALTGIVLMAGRQSNR